LIDAVRDEISYEGDIQDEFIEDWQKYFRTACPKLIYADELVKAMVVL